ncbi:MAG: hemolysin III family protein [Myxococcales bacterium]|nr:hemolysin III family protein [Myxococcales bacterium]
MASQVRSPTKPLLRGVSHQVAFFVAVVATAWLVRGAPSERAAAAALVFGTSLALLLGTSALYHRIDWQPQARARMRRLDHAAIFILIAGGYTPLLWLVPSPDPGAGGGKGALLAVWLGAAVGVVKSMVWSQSPKWVTAAISLAVGWMVVGPVIDRAPAMSALSVGCVVASGVLYSLGAVVYAARRPDPVPRVFGYHEVFHALVVLASACLFVHVTLVVRGGAR